MGRITDIALKNLKYRISERIGSRGDGALLFERRASGVVEVYFRYRFEGSDRRIKIGHYNQKGGAGITLVKARSKAIEYANLKKEHPHLKEWLELERFREAKDEKEAVRELRDELLKGSLADLVVAYTAHLERQGKKSSSKAKYLLTHYVLEPFPQLATTRASEITSDDIVVVIRRMLSSGITTTANRVRSYLMAAYNYARSADNDPRQANEHGKLFAVGVNPVEAVPRQQDYERVRDRILTADELRTLWNEFGNTLNVGSLMALLVRLVISLGGQRPLQLLACRWEDYDLDRRQVTIIDSKGRRATPRKHVVPLTTRAIEILKEVEKITGDYPWPFTVNGKAPYSAHALSVAVARYLKGQSKLALENGTAQPAKFISKDLRRTCKQFMIDAGISRETRNLLQNHGLTGVDIRHYDHDDHLPEKRAGLRRYDQYLKKVLGNEDAKVVEISTAKN